MSETIRTNLGDRAHLRADVDASLKARLDRIKAASGETIRDLVEEALTTSAYLRRIEKKHGLI